MRSFKPGDLVRLTKDVPWWTDGRRAGDMALVEGAFGDSSQRIYRVLFLRTGIKWNVVVDWLEKVDG
jgi:hypothetical protein